MCSLVTSISDPTNTSSYYLVVLHYCQSGSIQTSHVLLFVKLLRFVQIERENDAQQHHEGRDGERFVRPITVVAGAAVYREGESTGRGQLFRLWTGCRTASIIICC